MRLRLGGVVDETLAEGPGARFAVWAQGCSLRCPGCCNPHFFGAAGGSEVAVTALLDRLAAARTRVEGITLLGGEPFEQAEPLAAFASGARALGLSVMTFSGYTLEELRGPLAPLGSATLLAETDLLVDGRYRAEEPESARRWAGSRNQRFHFLSSRYQPGIEAIAPGEPARTVELRLSPDGGLHVSGWPERWRLGSSRERE